MTSFGRYLEEFEVGDVYRHWPGKTVTEADNHLFCCLTMAVSPIHTDDHYAELAHGRAAGAWSSARTSTRCCWG